MSDLGKRSEGLLRRYGKAIIHLRDQIDAKRFGLLFGAGVGKPLGFPTWEDLVDRISKDEEVGGGPLLANTKSNISITSKTQMLFQHYKAQYIENLTEPYSKKIERQIQGQWRRIIHRALYKEVPENPIELNDGHPYLKEFVSIVANSQMTVNYNFDDSIEQLVILYNEDKEGKDKCRVESTWNVGMNSKPGTSVIYHPNGFLPRNLLNFPSEMLVFSEDTFADQLIQSMAGHHASLLHHLSKTTCLFMGLSLNDATLRHLLRQNAIINPAHYHYCINWVEDENEHNNASEKSLRDANFDVYNLITLFLTNDDIAELGKLLSMDRLDLKRAAEEMAVPTKYLYYLTGPIGSGKTTCLTYMGDLNTIEEWIEPRLQELAKPWTSLTSEEQKKVDAWLIRQFELKNYQLMNANMGMYVIDRTPLDPISFTEDIKILEKAEKIISGLSPGSSVRKVQGGEVIFLSGDPKEMDARVAGRHKESSAELISNNQEKLEKIHNLKGTKKVETAGTSICEVLKQVSRIIYLEEYEVLDLSGRLKDISKNGIGN